jgi:hypothetical protein
VSERGEQIYSERRSWDHKNCLWDRQSEFIPTNLVFSKCYLGSSNWIQSNSSPTVFWYGNSFNEQLMPAAARIQAKMAMRMNSFAVSGCPATLNMEYEDEKVPGYCAQTFKKYINFVLKSGARGSKLIVAASPSYWNGGLAGNNSLLRLNGSALTIMHAKELYKEELIELSRVLVKRGMHLIVATGTPAVTSNPDVCSNLGSKFNRACNVSLDPSALKSNDELKKILVSANTQSNSFQVLDIYTPLVEEIKKRRHDVYSLYYNPSHLSKKGALLLVPALSDAIRFDN